MLLRELEVPPRAMILDVGCATGYPSLELLKKMDDQGRIIAIDPLGPLLDVARKKAGDLAGKRIFFRSEAATYKLAFADEVYDLVLSNLGVVRLDSPRKAVAEFARVNKCGGRTIITLPLAGTYNEFYDIYREVLTKNDQHDVLARLEEHITRSPDVDTVVSWMEEAGLEEIEVEVEAFSLLFKSSREFFFAPVVEFGPLSAWKEVAGKGKVMQEIFWHIKEAIDAYFSDRAFEITVKAGCFRGTKPDTPPVEEIEPVTPTRDDATPSRPGDATPVPPEPAFPDDFHLDEEEEDEEG
jgi:ubiquinone/menaquinone biosynthesis C-methylase UbiE